MLVSNHRTIRRIIPENRDLDAGYGLYDRNLIADMSQADQAGVAIMTHLYLVFRMSVMLPAVLTDRCHPFLQAECRDSTLKYDLAASFHILTSSQFITTYPSHSASYNLCSLNSVVKYDD